jgi:hypothetical protein
MNAGFFAESPSALRISPIKIDRFASSTNVFGQRRSYSAAFETARGRCSISADSSSKAFGVR